MHFEAALEQDLSIVANDGRLALKVYWHELLGCLVLDLIGAEDDTLAVEVCQDIIRTNILHAPVKRVEDIGFLRHELVVSERHSDVLEQLLHARVSHLVVLRANENAGSGDQSHDLVISLVAEVADTDNVLLNIGHLKICVENVDTVMESLSMVLKLAAEISHPVDEELTGTHVEGTRVVALAKRLAGYETVEDLVHRHLCLELLIARSHAKHEEFAQCLLIAATSAVSLRKCRAIVECAAGGTIAVVRVAFVGQEARLAAGALAANFGAF